MRIPEKNLITCLITSFGFLIISPLAYATLSDITGTYSGTVIDNEFSCFFDPTGVNTPVSGSTESAVITLTINSFNTSTGAFSGTGTEGPFSSDGLTHSFTFNGFVDSAGNVFSSSFTATEGTGDLITGDLDGSNIQGGTFALGATGQDVIPNSDNIQCLIDVDGTLTLASGNTVVNPELTPSSTITEAALFNTQIQGTISDISSHISGALSGIRFSGGPRVTENQLKMEGTTGLNTGDGFAIPYGVWGSYSYTDYDNDLSSTAFEGNNHTFLGGIDFGFWENTVLGVAFGYDNGDIDTTFNGGHQDTDSYTIAPYFGALLTDQLSIDFTLGYTRVDYDQFRTVTGSTTQITSSPDSDRWFGALNLNGITYYNNWIIGGRIGALWAKNNIDSFTESNGAVVADSRTKVTTLSVAGDVAYSFQEYEPFVGLSYQYDAQLTEITVIGGGAQPSNDNDDFLLTAGMRYFGNNGISGNLEYTKRFDREDFDEDRVSVSVRVDF